MHEDESKDVRTMRQAELRLQEYRRQHRTLAYEVGKNWGWGQDNKWLKYPHKAKNETDLESRYAINVFRASISFLTVP